MINYNNGIKSLNNLMKQKKEGAKYIDLIILLILFFIWALPLCGRRLSGFTGLVF